MSIKQDVKELIEHGFDKDIIMMSTGLSSSQFEFFKNQIEMENKKPTVKSKLQLIREKYYEIYNSEPENVNREVKPLTSEQIEEITKRLDEAEKLSSEIIRNGHSSNIKKAYDIINQFSYMEDLDLPYELAKRAYSILSGDIVRHIKDPKTNGKVRKLIEKNKNKYYNSINVRMKELTNPDDLEQLLREVKDFFGSAYLAYSTIQSKITARIQELKQAKLKKELTISDETIDGIVSMIIDPKSNPKDIDERIQEAGETFFKSRKKVIEETVKNPNLARLQMPTMAGSIRQVSHLVVEAIQKEGIIIERPEMVYERLLGITGSKNVASHAVMKSYANNGKYEEAELFIKSIFNNYKDLEENSIRRSAITDIKKRKISSYIVRAINAKQASLEEENAFLRTIETGINEAGLDPLAIVIGKTKDGRKTISWGEVSGKKKPALKLEDR